MVFENLDWAIPEDIKTGVLLDVDELKLIDWVLCPASGTIPSPDLDILIDAWHEVRLSIWSILSQAKANDLTQRYLLPLSQADAKYLLTVVPIDFRWSTGLPSGFSLKRRLYFYLQGITPPEDLPKQEEPSVTDQD